MCQGGKNQVKGHEPKQYYLKKKLNDLLAINGFMLELEINTVQARTGFYITKDLKYKRRGDLEGVDSNIVILDILNEKEP